jgi:hypothetical protein
MFNTYEDTMRASAYAELEFPGTYYLAYRDFPENRYAKSGDIVKIIQTDTVDKRPVEDIICTDEDYRDLFKRAGLGLVRVYKPLAKDDEPYSWINETRIPPWVIYVLEKS